MISGEFSERVRPPGAVSLIPVTGIAVGVGLAVETYEAAAAAWVSVHLMGLAIVVVVWRLGFYRTAAPLSVLGLALKELPPGKTVLLAAAVLGASIGLTILDAGALSANLEIASCTAQTVAKPDLRTPPIAMLADHFSTPPDYQPAEYGREQVPRSVLFPGAADRWRWESSWWRFP